MTTVYQYQKDLAKYQTRVDNLHTSGIQDVNQKYLDVLRRALEQKDGQDKVFAHHITDKSGKYIVFCANKEHMFRRKGMPLANGCGVSSMRIENQRKAMQSYHKSALPCWMPSECSGRNLTCGSTGTSWRRNIKDAMEIWIFQQNTRQRMAFG